LRKATLHGPRASRADPGSTLALAAWSRLVILHGGASKISLPTLGSAVVFALLASYGLSRTLTPITIGCYFQGEHHGPRTRSSAGCATGFLLTAVSMRGFEHMPAAAMRRY